MKVWSTKYALTMGIEEVEGEIYGEHTIEHWRAAYQQFLHGEGKEWHRTLEGATERAEVMRENRLASLRKSISKLEKMQIKVKAC